MKTFERDTMSCWESISNPQHSSRLSQFLQYEIGDFWLYRKVGGQWFRRRVDPTEGDPFLCGYDS